jgi:hypothetical protein
VNAFGSTRRGGVERFGEPVEHQARLQHHTKGPSAPGRRGADRDVAHNRVRDVASQRNPARGNEPNGVRQHQRTSRS